MKNLSAALLEERKRKKNSHSKIALEYLRSIIHEIFMILTYRISSELTSTSETIAGKQMQKITKFKLTIFNNTRKCKLSSKKNRNRGIKSELSSSFSFYCERALH